MHLMAKRASPQSRGCALDWSTVQDGRRSRHFADWRGQGYWIKSAIFPLAFSAATGFALGASFSWFAILLSNLALATLSAIVLQIAGFDGLWGIAYIVVCLGVNQFAYVLGAAFVRRASDGGEERNESAEAKEFISVISLLVRRNKQK
jgi:hypothetical protein